MNRAMDRIKNRRHRMSLINTARVLATWFGVGLLPKAPGTWGSLAALPIGYVITTWGSSKLLGILAILIFIIGIWASNVISNEIGIADPSEIVIDEVVGQWIVLLAIPPNIILYFFAFVLFRLFDIWKPWPVSWADREIKGGLGIMLDDVFAAIFASVILWLGQITYQTYT
jgi:phosphatidylglycerophosphatase A